ncbi:Proton-coupled thiamine transporter YuaJ [Tepidanaerobacter acetatoxydans Re1]|uniref:Proton-coupled thiamine transporter YuaJ n=1 Tax=Tepidanaerobacter acetatoxydans (strain DSM 21804 / JCM 16047 / Re1) TaxID=1209989 RepID=F4LVA2_TEPAE|nr:MULTISPECIES: energy-coupled thiamine transporter ThiT [Tepidanaerobacter]AEE90677.1 proton-coupled thiamine transporter YuaJ [Tepidanaerobacter acetatoxydans Re1]CCP25211.1 Proton-coupled thiamine transporter YuaJ [Tepidanaerobacter acetatoxydans Re1]
MNTAVNFFEDFAEITPITWLVLFCIFAFVVVLSTLGKHTKFNTKAIVYGGLCVAVAFILSYIRLYRWPQGGSITLASALPIFIYAYIFGPAAGLMAGTAYGLLQLVQDPYILHPFQVFLDYILAFAAWGLAGFFRNNISLGIIAGGLGQIFSSFLSGVIFFASFAPEGMSPIVYSIAVNGTVLGTDILICLLISMIPKVRKVIEQLKNQVK